MDFEQLAKIENESERVNRTYDIFHEDSRLNHSKAARVEFLTTVRYIERYLKEGDRILVDSKAVALRMLLLCPQGV